MTTNEKSEVPKPLLGIGACLAGNAVRYNGDTNPPNEYVRDVCTHFDTRAFCPEMGIGLGVPRPPIHLVSTEQTVRIVDVKTHRHDYTDQIRDYARQILNEEPLLCGYILVKGSPSCGYGRVKRYSEEGQHLASDQNGIFAAALGVADPLLPLEDDGRLIDPGLRKSFVARACAYHEWKTLNRQGLNAHRLIEFYERYKHRVTVHNLASHKLLGNALAYAGEQVPDALATEFISTLMASLAHRATAGSHNNAALVT